MPGQTPGKTNPPQQLYKIRLSPNERRPRWPPLFVMNEYLVADAADYTLKGGKYR